MTSFLQFSNLTKRYGATRALDGINLSIERGNVLAVLGPNGAGKSTLFGCLLGLTLPTSGEIRIVARASRLCDSSGRADSETNRRDACATKVGYVAERVALYPQRTVAENANFFAQLGGESETEVEKQLRRVGLFAVRDLKVRQLSKGMLQRLGLAIALCGQPQLLVLDEPFNGLDPALLDTLQFVLREENERGATLLISTHTMSAVEPLATHVAILLEGRLAAFGTLDELRAEHCGGDSLEMIYHRIARQRCEAEEVFA